MPASILERVPNPGMGLDPTPEEIVCIRRAIAKHEAARYALQRARNLLLAGRRNVAWWRFYYQMTAQYHAERLMLTIAEPHQRLRNKVPENLTRLRRAYNALRTALDYTLPRDSQTPVSRWLTRAWAEMTLAGATIGVKSAHGLRIKLDVYLFAQLRWLNEREGLDASSGFVGALDRLNQAIETIASNQTREDFGLRRVIDTRKAAAKFASS